MKRPLWYRHPAVNNDLSFGERAADFLKHWFGTWTALGGVGTAIAFWIIMQVTPAHWDRYPYILLNLCLSCLAAVQGIILQISANRGDRISSEVATHTEKNTDTLMDMQSDLLTMQKQQMNELEALKDIHADVVMLKQTLEKADGSQ